MSRISTNKKNQNSDSAHTVADICIVKSPKETIINSPATQLEPVVQEKRPASSTSSSSCQDNIATAKTPNDVIISITETVNTQTINGTFANKLKDSTKIPHNLLKK